MSSNQRVFFSYSGSSYPGLARLLGAESRLIRALSTHISHNGRCRSQEYMRALATEHGAVAVQEIKGPKELPSIEAGSEVVLLWADANGVGCRPVERRLMRAGARVSVLTGRRRMFELSPRRWRALQYRRVLEKYLVAEALFTAAFFLVTPWLIAWDWARGRK